MSVAYLFLTISVLPITVGFALLRLYGISRLTVCIFLFMLLTGIWQIDVAVLYLKGILEEETILLLFKIFRIGVNFVCPLVFYLILTMVDKTKVERLGTWKSKLLLLIVNKKCFYLVTAWSVVVYIINLTSYGVADLRIEKTEHLAYYYPVYGSLSYFFAIYMVMAILVMFLLGYCIKYMNDRYLQKFMKTFALSSPLLFIPGLINFIPNTGLVLTSVGIIIYTIIILVSFIQMYNNMMKNYQKLLERQQKLDAIGILSSTLIHEIKNSLTLINGYTTMLFKEGELNQKQKQMLSFIKIGGDQLEDFVKSYSSFMKSNELTFKVTDIKKLIENTVAPMKGQPGLRLTFHCRDEWVMGFVSQSALQQVLVNLIRNSIEAVPESKAPKITIELITKNDLMMIDIIDNGNGIHSDDFEAIFQPFHSSKESTGLGLPFCKKIIIEHRGDIKIMSSNDEGTHVRIILPQHEYSQSVNI